MAGMRLPAPRITKWHCTAPVGKILKLDFPYQRVSIGATYAVIASKFPAFSFTVRGWLEEPNG